MHRLNQQINERQDLAGGLRVIEFFTRENLLILAIMGMAMFFGLALPKLPDKLQIVLLGLIPAGMLVVLILRNPFFGVIAFYIYDYIRPEFLIPALRPLKLAMLIEGLTLVSFLFYFKKTRTLKWDKFFAFYIVLLIGMAFTIVTATNNRYAFDRTEAMIVVFVVFYMATNLIDSYKRLNLLVWLMLIMHVYFAIWGFAKNGKGAGSFMLDENDFAMALNVIIPFAFFLFVGAKKYYIKIIGLLMLLIYIAGVVISLSRGGWVGLVAVLLYCIMSTKKKMGALAAAAIAAAVVLAVAPSNYWSEVRSISNTQDRTAQSRFHYWKAAVRMYRDHPIIGIGADNGPLRMPEYYIGDVDPATRWKKTFHGTLPLVLAELGTIGIVCFLTLFFLALKYLRWVKKQASRRGDDDLLLMANSIIGGLIGFIVTGTFISVAYYPQLWTLYLMAMSLVFIARERYAGGTPLPEKARGSVII